jgi:hypothetical protein
MKKQYELTNISPNRMKTNRKQLKTKNITKPAENQAELAENTTKPVEKKQNWPAQVKTTLVPDCNNAENYQMDQNSAKNL